MVVLDVLTFNFFCYFSCNVLFEVDSILCFRRFASRCPCSLLLCLIVSVMKKMVWCCCCCEEDLHELDLWLAHLSSWGRASENNGLMKGVAMSADEDEMENEACVGGLCFLQPHFSYFPPRFYRWIPGRVVVLFCLSPLSLLLLLLGFVFVKLDNVFLFVLHSMFLYLSLFVFSFVVSETGAQVEGTSKIEDWSRAAIEDSTIDCTSKLPWIRSPSPPPPLFSIRR